MFKRLFLIVAAAAIVSAGSTASAFYPYRYGYRSYYAPPVVRHHYVAPRAYRYPVPYSSYYAPSTSYYHFGAPAVRSYYAPSYAPAPAYVAPYGGGVSIQSPGVSLRIGF